MADVPRARLTSRIEQGVLIFTLAEPHLRTDKVVDAIREEIVKILTATGLKDVVIDLKAVESLSSTGLRPMLAAHRQVEPHGGRLVLCGVAPEVAKVITLTRLVGLSRSPFHLEPDTAAAVAFLTSQPGKNAPAAGT